MPCSSAAVFELLHDYARRLEWDTLLCEARLTRGCNRPEKGATSLCVGKPFFGLIGLETRYVTFSPGKIAAVEMINRPPFFESFAASIRHQDVASGESEAIYKFQFRARPRLLRWLLEPLMLLALRRETKERLAGLSAFLQRQIEEGAVAGNRRSADA